MPRISKKLGLAIGGGLIAAAAAIAVLTSPATPGAISPNAPPSTTATTHHSQSETFATTPGQNLEAQETTPLVTVPEYVPEGFTSAEASFPLLPEGAGIRIEMPFSYDGLNPDADIAEGINIAALSITNQSGRHLAEAELILATTDGIHIRFYAQHIPNARKAVLFCTDNLELPPQDQWHRIYYRVVSAEADSLLETGLRSEIIGTQVVLTNETGESLPPFVLYCHDLLSEEYFGGKAYAYNVNTIPSGQSVTIDAADSLIGIIDAVYAGQITE